MDNFRIIRPSPDLSPYVRHYWMLKTVNLSPHVVKTVPTGMLSMVFHRGSLIRSLGSGSFHPRTFLCGQESSYSVLEYRGGVDMIAVVFRPAGARMFFDMPLDLLHGLNLPASDMQNRGFTELEDKLSETLDDTSCVHIIEKFLTGRLADSDGLNHKRVSEAVRLIEKGETELKVLADAACLSPKHFRRIFSGYIGANPKQFLRTVRFQRALHILEKKPGVNMTELSCECGYYDQPHMVREFRTFLGLSPTGFVAAISPHSDYFS